MSEFERLTAEQIAIEAGNDEPTEQNIIDAMRICRDCNFYRVFKGLVEL